MEILKERKILSSKGAVLPEYSLSLVITVIAFLAITTGISVAISYRTNSVINSVTEPVPCELNSEGKREFDGSPEACF